MLREKFQKESRIEKNFILTVVTALVICGMIFYWTCFIAFAEEFLQFSRPYATELPWESVWEASQLPIEISGAAQSISAKLLIPPFPVIKDKVLCLRFRARIQASSGWNYILSMKWNGQPIISETKSHSPRLINRHISVETSHPVENKMPVCRVGDIPCFITFFGPDFDRLDPQILSDRDEGYWYLFDVSDLVIPGKPTEIEFVNTVFAAYFGDNPSLRMVVDNVEIGAVDKAAVDVLRRQTGWNRRETVEDTSSEIGKAVATATKLPWESAWKSSHVSIEIPLGVRQPESAKLLIPSLPVIKDKVLCLRFRARIHSSSGWNYFLGIKWNGQPIVFETKNHNPRLINRHVSVETSHPVEKKMPAYMSFGAAGDIPCFITFFGPDFDRLDPQVLSDRDEGYWYVFDVSDLVIPGKPTEIEFVNTALASYFGNNPSPSLRMVVDSVEIGAVDKAAIDALRQTMLERREILPGVSLNVGKTVATIVSGGGLQIRASEEIAFVETRIQVLGKENWLRCFTLPFGDDDVWKPVCKSDEKSILDLRADTDRYIFHRKVKVDNDRLSIEDTFTNRTDDVLGVILSHQIITPAMPNTFFLGGVERRRFILPFRSPENPTIFVSQDRFGLGLVVEDDVLRLQFEAEVESNKVSCGTRHFGLGPGKSYTLRWALYPGSIDYFDFVNAVRRDWKVNFTILGSFDFFPALEYQDPKDAAKLKKLLSRQSIKLFGLAPWFHYGSSLDLTREKYKDIMQKAMRVIKSVQPDALCIALTECNLSPVPLSFFGDTLPADFGWGYMTGGVLGKPLPQEATRIIDQSPWKDSVLRDINGSPRVDTFYVREYSSPKGLNLMVYPNLNNYRYAQMMEHFSFLLDDVGFDGVYIDQFSLAFQMLDHFTYEKWDGQTVDINEKTGEVTQKYSDLCFLSATARKKLCEFVLSKGKFIVANSPPAIQLMQSLPIFRFMETGGYDSMLVGIPDASMCAAGQLASPIALSKMWNDDGKTNQNGKFLMRTLIAHLRYGMLYYYYSSTRATIPMGAGDYGPINHMFPFTPVELHSGWILGKERLITCVSGTFLWKNKVKPMVHLFDVNGVEIPIMPTITQVDKGFHVSLKLKDWQQVAVIE